MKKIVLIYLGIALLFISGFWIQGTSMPISLSNSTKYFVFLIVLSFGSLVIIPYLLHRFLQKHTTKELFFSLTPSLFLIVVIYSFGNIYYYLNQEHLFDPFLQIPPSDYHFESPRDTNSIRVLCLGGSTTIYEYPIFLQQYFNDKKTKKKYEVLNAGMSWYTSKHSLINYAAYCRKFEPDVVVVMHAINDLYRSFSPPRFSIGKYESDYSHFYGPSIYGARPESFFQFLYNNFRKIWFGKNLKPRDFEINEFLSLTDFEDYLSQLVDLIQQDGAKPILVSQGHLYQENMDIRTQNKLWMDRTFCEKNNTFPNSRSLAKAMDVYNLTTKAISEKYQIQFVHAEKNLPKDLDYFVDDVHYTTKGSMKLAKMIGDAILY
jgi:lysophospholipase L1-like esterase